MFNIILYLSRAFTVPNHIRFPISKHIAMLFIKIISIVCVNPPGKQLSQTLFNNMKQPLFTQITLILTLKNKDNLLI